jgi:PAS domain S-box-containing protein
VNSISDQSRGNRQQVFLPSPPAILVSLASVILLFLLSLVNYLLFRTVAAIGIVMISFALFLIVWNTRRNTGHGFFAVIGVGLLFAGILELVTTLSLIGSGVIPAAPGVVLALATWSFQAFTLLAAPFAAGKKIAVSRLLVAYSAVLLAILGLIFAGIFPLAPGSGGLADVVIRAGLVLLLGAASAALYNSRKKCDPAAFPLLMAGDLLILGSGVLLLFAENLFQITDVAGYVLWLAALYLLYLSCVHEVIERPAQHIRNDLNECRQQFRIMNDYTYNWEYWTGPDRTFVYTTPSCTAMTGFSPEEFYTDHTLVERMIHPKDQPRISAHFTEDNPSANFSSLEFRIVTRDKNVRWIHHVCHPVYDSDGVLLGRRATNRDITMQKNAEREILHLASFSMQAPVLIAEINPDGKPLFLNPAMQKTLAELGLQGPDIFVPGDLLRLLKEGGTGIDDAYSREVQVFDRYFDESVLVTPEFGSLRLYITDVTRQREAESRIVEQSRFLSTLLDTIPVPIFYRDLSGLYLGCNASFEEFTGIRRDQLIGKPAYDQPFSGPSEMKEGNDIRVFPGHGQETRELTMRCKDGSMHDVLFFGAPFFNAEGKVGGVIGTFLDITERKQMEKALAEMNEELSVRVRERTQELEESNIALREEVTRRSLAERNLQETLRYTRTVFESNFDPMAVLTREGMITDVNAALEQMTGVGRESLIGSSLSLYLKGTGDLDEKFRQIMVQGEVEGIGGSVLHAGGHTTPVVVNASVFRDSQENVAGIIVTAHDITRQKEDEAKIRTSLQEKTVLLREIHHRVKNNLQIIISLLNLQSRKVTDKQMLDSLRESIQRVRAMSLVHEKLYSGGDLAHIGIRSYIYSLVNSLVAFYNVSTGNIALKLDVEDLQVDVSTAIPLGLIINELISNSIKHAFPDGRKGVVSVSAHDVDGWFQITVGDDGIGFPPGLDWKRADTLGLKLVNALSEQLEGSLTLVHDHGTVITLRIPLS